MKNIQILFTVFILPVVLSAQVITYQTFDFPAPGKMKTDTLGVAETKSIVLEEKRCIDYVYNKDNDLDKYYFLYRKIFIKSDPGIEENNKIYIPGNNLSDILFFKSRTLTSAGAVATEQFRTDLNVEDDKESGRFFKCAIEGLKTGMIVEYFYLSRVYPNIKGTEFIQTKQQKLKVEYEIVSPSNLIFEAKLYNYPGSTFKKGADTTKNTISCTMYNLAEKSTEEYSATEANLTRVEYKLAYNYASDRARKQTFEGAGILYYNAYHNDIPSSKALKKLIKENDISKKSMLEKIYFIEQFAKTSISTSDESPYETPDDVLKYRIASSVTMMRFFIAYFRENEIKYEIYLGSDRSSRPFDKSFDTWSFLENVMFYFPEVDKYMDPDSYVSRLGLIPYDMAESDAMNIKEMKLGSTAKGLSVIKRLPAAMLENSCDTLTAHLNFSKDMATIKMHVSRRILGYMADNVRPFYYYSDKDKREEFMKDFLKQGDDNLVISNIQVNNFDYVTYLEETPFAVDCDMEHKTLVERSGDKLMLKVGEVIGRQAELYQEKKRTSDIDVRYPHQYVRNIKVTIPAGYKVVNLSSAEIKFTFKDDKGKDLMGFVSTATQKDNVITIYITEYYAFTQMSKSKFDDFKKVINAAADFNKVILIFEKI